MSGEPCPSRDEIELAGYHWREKHPNFGAAELWRNAVAWREDWGEIAVPVKLSDQVPSDEEIVAAYWATPSTGVRSGQGFYWFKQAVAWLLKRGLPVVEWQSPAIDDQQVYNRFRAWLADATPDWTPAIPTASWISQLQLAYEAGYALQSPKPPEPVDPFEAWWEHAGIVGMDMQTARKVWDAAQEAQS